MSTQSEVMHCYEQIAPLTERMLVLARSLWSMPPDHGAAAVRLILEDRAAAADWRDEHDGMRLRLDGLRATLHR